MEQISTLRRVFMWFCAACFYGFQFILRVSPGVIANELMGSLMVDACMLGALTCFYYNGYSAMQVPSGLILDRIGVRIPLSMACFMCSVGCIVFSVGETITSLSLGRGLMGVGSAFGFLSCVKVASENFTPRRMALLVSLTMVVGTIGGTSGGAPFAGLVSQVGWREAYKILAVASVVLSVIIFFAFQNGRSTDTHKSAQTARSESAFQGLSCIMRNPQTWYFGIYGCMMYVPLSGFADLWGVPYIEAAFNVNRTVAGGVVSMFYVGLAAGATLWSAYVARVQSYRKGMFWSAVWTGICLVFVICIPGIPMLNGVALHLTYLFLSLAGAAAAGQFIAFAGISELNPRHRTATASGVHNMLCMFSGVIMQPLIGKVLDMTGGKAAIGALPSYGLASFQTALLLVPASILVAVMIMVFIKESYPSFAINNAEEESMIDVDKINKPSHAEI